VAGGIYLRDGDDLVEMTEQPYDSEDILQELLAKYPNLLAGDQMDSSDPRRWLLVSREMGLPSDELEGGRWSVDHLFLDQEGIPTLVEVKRSSDTRLRREVVGQLLEYAANAVLYWPVERIAEEFANECERRDADPDEELRRLAGTDIDADTFWGRVRTNLQAGRVRLVFVADVIPRELRRIVEFLNEQMNPADVFAVEVKQFAGGNSQALVPRLIGATERKSPTATKRRQWDEESFFGNLAEHNSDDVVEATRALLAGLRRNGQIQFSWGTGVTTASLIPWVGDDSNWVGLFRLIARGGRIETYFGIMKNRPAFESEAKRRELLDKYNTLPGVDLPPDGIDRYPSFDLGVLTDSEALARFLEINDWIAEEFLKT